MRTALIPGTFDPITLGHVDVIERSSQIFDHIVVGVASSPKKGGTGPLFCEEDRIDFIVDAVKHLDNVEVKAFSNLLVDFAASASCDRVLRAKTGVFAQASPESILRSQKRRSL